MTIYFRQFFSFRQCVERIGRSLTAVAASVMLSGFVLYSAHAEIKIERTTYTGLSSYPGGATYTTYVKFRSSDQMSNVKIWLYFNVEGWKLYTTQKTVLTPDTAAATFSQFLATPQPNARSGFVQGVLSLPSTLRGTCTHIWVEGTNARTGYLEYDYRAGCDLA